MTVSPWPFDVPGDPDYPVYLRGQTEEVLPGVLSPMMCTFGVPIIERGWRIHMVETMGIIDEPASDHTFLGIFGGRGYMNLSVSARSGAMSMGVRAEDFAEQFAEGREYLEKAAVPREGDEERKARIQDLIQRHLTEHPEALLAEDRALALAHRERGRAERATSDDRALLERAHALAPDASRCFSRIMLVGTLGAIGFGALQRGLEEHYGDEAVQLCRELLSGLGDVESAAPAQRLAALGALDGDEHRRAFDAFLRDHGHRGVNEFEISAPSWELVPDAVDRMVAAARDAPAKGDAADRSTAALARIEADGVPQRWPEFGFWRDATSFYVAARERSKDSFVLVYNEIRLDLHELGRRLVASGRLGDPLDVFLMTFDELRAAVDGADGADVPSGLEARAEHMVQLSSLKPPSLVTLDAVPPLDEWELVGGDDDESDELHGVAGSPGVARGRVRVVLDPYADQPPEPGEVLVAPITDPGWTLMFMAAEAVVVEVGGMLSHAVIVAREIGIPAVVSVSGCCSKLHTGDLVEVDGDRGVVRVLERTVRT